MRGLSLSWGRFKAADLVRVIWVMLAAAFLYAAFTEHMHGNFSEDEISYQLMAKNIAENGSVNIAGISEPIITQRLNEADIRMKDGEASLLGGLSDLEDNNTLSGFPGLTNIPALGYLFGSKTKNKSDDEILIALIPHIVRAPDLTALGQPGVLAGTEQVTRVERKRDGAAAPTSSSSSAVEPTTAPEAPAPPYTPTPNPPTTPAPVANPYTGPPGQPNPAAAPGPNPRTTAPPH